MKTKTLLFLILSFLPFTGYAQQKYKDALLHDLRGNVKLLTYVYSQESDAVGSIDYDSQTEFKSNGEQIRENDNCIDRKRDSQGRIIYEKYIVDSQQREFKYVYNANGMVAKIICIDSDGIQTDINTYNNKGGLIKIVTMRDNKEVESTCYTITAYDKKGNWTKRKSKTENDKLCIESRVIEYW